MLDYDQPNYQETTPPNIDIETAIKISKELNPDRDGFVPVNALDLQNLVNITGEKTLQLLNEMQTGLFLNVDLDKIPLKFPRASGRRHPLDLVTNYTYTNLATFFDFKIVYISTFIKKPNILNHSLPEKIIQFDFSTNDSTDFSISEDHRAINSPGHNSMSGRVFFRKLLKIVESVSPDTIIQVCPYDEQRKRLYSRALKHLPNIKFI